MNRPRSRPMIDWFRTTLAAYSGLAISVTDAKTAQPDGCDHWRKRERISHRSGSNALERTRISPNELLLASRSAGNVRDVMLRSNLPRSAGDATHEQWTVLSGAG